jgi:guanylate kinase
MSLTLICGPSGVGKTTVIHQMMQRHQFHILPNFTTRPLRIAETERGHLPSETVKQLERSGKTAFVNDIFGHQYGVLRSSLDDAFSSSLPYVFDIGPQFLDKIAKQFDHVIFLMPTSIEQLIEQLRGADRLDRVAGCREEYRMVEEYSRKWESDPRSHRVVNLPRQIDQTLAEVLSFVERLK